ncbi:MAG: fibronectin type III domain-containing protein [Polyangiaceae bacterium]
MRRLTAIILLLVHLLSVVQAADVCVGASSSGSASGANWSNQIALSSVAWNRGDTYWIADGTYSATNFGATASGNTLITVKKATVADHGPSTGWSDAYGDGTAIWPSINFPNGSDDWVIDGQTGGGPGAWSSGFGFIVTNTSSTNLITLSGTVDNITVLHVNAYSDRIAGNTAGVKATTGTTSNVRFSHCKISDMFGPIFQFANATSPNNAAQHWKVEKCYLARNLSTAEEHTELANILNHNTDLTFRWNLIEGIDGTGVWCGVNAGSTTGLYIYGNIIGGESRSPLIFGTSHPLHGCRIYNNTFTGNSGGQGTYFIGDSADGGTSTDCLSRNNLWYLNQANTMRSWFINMSYEWFYGNYRSGVGNLDSEGVASGSNNQTGTANPFVSYNASPLLGNFQLSANTSAGTSTSDIPDNAVDMLGNSRTTGSRGALEYGGGGGDTTAPTAPTGLSATATSATTASLSWTASTDDTAVTGYRVERSSTSSTTGFSQIGTPSGTSYSDSGLTASTQYWYRVSAVDAVPNVSSYSTAATATTPASTINDNRGLKRRLRISATDDLERWTTLAVFTDPEDHPRRFYRLDFAPDDAP